ncbi:MULTISPECIES: cupredoxin domain-containing protein [unclassified Saccharothrix]|uniref:cupredoxin domain-containing protein n=1 Tax=unclassified Saccharothrix TaxID=2593673 RepID=UPI00307D542A
MLARTALLGFVALLLALAAPPAHAAEGHAVPIRQYAYQPGSMTVRVGDTVTWTNEDQAAHDVVTSAGPAAFQSPMLATGQSWTFTFTVPGTYAYYCSVHPDMRAEITVLPVETPQPAPQTTQPVAEVPQQPHVQSPQVVTTTPPVTTTATQAATTPTPSGLNPMLLLAGLVAAVTTFCLLLIGSRPDKG